MKWSLKKTITRRGRQTRNLKMKEENITSPKLKNQDIRINKGIGLVGLRRKKDNKKNTNGGHLR